MQFPVSFLDLIQVYPSLQRCSFNTKIKEHPRTFICSRPFRMIKGSSATELQVCGFSSTMLSRACVQCSETRWRKTVLKKYQFPPLVQSQAKHIPRLLEGEQKQ
ncbi:hypothetical protein AMECASPLE_037266 [Ameca splendens]|uniref:Uncharacterized protein n=1 Tax=Ameca splendens TaxID=208324 RepID=A0ABV0XWU0_9TELE